MRLIRSAAVQKREDGKHMKKVLSLVLAIVMVALVGIVPGALAEAGTEERYFFWELGSMEFRGNYIDFPTAYEVNRNEDFFIFPLGTPCLVTDSTWKPENIKVSGIYTYYLLDDGTIALLAIDSLHQTAKTIIPERIDGYVVSRIGLDANVGCSLGVYNTQSNQWYSQERLTLFSSKVTEVVLPDTVEVIGCGTLVTIDDYAGGSNFINKITANNVKEIGQNMPDKMIVPSTLTKLGNGAFSYASFNSGRNKVTLSDDLVEIGAFAFADSALKELTIPGSVQKIGMYACADMHNLRTAKLKKGLTTVGEGMFMMCPKLKEITIPETVTTIQAHAFEQCEKLGKVTIAKNSELTSIGEGAFRSCATLKSIVLPEGMTTIEKDAFFDCSKLSTVTLPASLTAIGDYAFDGCSDKLKFTVVEGSYAQQWAESKGFQTKVTKAK